MAACTSNTTSLYEAGMQIAYTTTQVDNNYLMNFPVLVKLTGDTGLSSHAQGNCGDVVFTDSTGRNLLNYEIEAVGATDCASGNLVAWVNIPILYSDVDTNIYMYYGNPAATSKANPTGTWSSNFAGVWHMKDATGTTLTDSTANTYTSTKLSSGHPTQGTGQIGDDETFASGDYSVTATACQILISEQTRILPSACGLNLLKLQQVISILY